MSIRPALIARLYKAIDQHRLSDAILLLTQQYGGHQLDPESRAAYFLEELREEGERMVCAEKLHQAEELFALALALYDRFFPNLHGEGIAAARRLSELMSEEKRDAELSRALDYAYEIVKRLEKVARGETASLPPHGQIADSLVRRHQIATYVDVVAHRKVVSGVNGKPLQVLVVEDNEDDADLVKEALASTNILSIQTHCAAMLFEGIDRLRAGGIDVVVLDLTLPDSDSLRTLQRVRDKVPNVPVVVLTGHDDDDFAFRAIKSGAHDYLVKGRTNGAMVLRSVLRAAEDRFTPRLPEAPAAQVNALIEFAPNGMMHLANDLTVFAMNPAFTNLVGANWSGKLLTEIWPEFTAERLMAASESAGGVELADFPLPPSSVHKGTVDLTIWPTRTPEGITDGMICMVARYAVPPIANLPQSGTSTESHRPNTDLEQFAYLAAHDLQEPLRTVISYLELLAERLAEQLDEKSENYINVATAAGKRMQASINDLLDYSRITTRGQTFVQTKMAQVVKFAIENLSATIQENDAHIEIQDLPVLAVDPGQMMRLFQNLIDNAIKFKRPDVRPTITVSAKQYRVEWEFVVKDNGIGLDMEHAERIFIIFQRLHTRQKYSGNGIGLALCKKIIERHGGRIWVESKVAQGSEFHFTIPIKG